MRRAVDDGRGGGRFLLTGSAAPLEQPIHSGAGRIVTIRMRPLGLAERALVKPTVSLTALLSGERPNVTGRCRLGLPEYTDEILGSGLPDLQRQTGRVRRATLDGYLARIVERDFADQGHPVRDPVGLRRWLTAYAAATATTATFETIRDAATATDGHIPARSTASAYRRILEQLWLLDPVPAWAPAFNRIARLALPFQAPSVRSRTGCAVARHGQERPVAGRAVSAVRAARRAVAREAVRIAGHARGASARAGSRSADRAPEDKGW